MSSNSATVPVEDSPKTSRADGSKAMQLLEDGITRIADSESFKRYLAFSRSFRSYSANNTMLIFLQAPDATMVAGYNKWKQLGRQVRKGREGHKDPRPYCAQGRG